MTKPINSLLLGRVPDPSLWARFFPQTIAMSKLDAQAHAHVIGKSGFGKSRFIAHLYVELIQAGYGATLIDPHGDLAKLVLALLQERGNPQTLERVMYLDLPRAERSGLYLPLNVLKQPFDPYTIASNVREAFHRAWPSLSGGSAPMFDTLIHAATKVLVSNGLPLTHMWKLLVDKRYRMKLLEQEPDRDIASVFTDLLDALSQQEQRIQSGSLLRRLYLLLSSPVIKHSLGSSELAVDFRSVMDERRALIVDLSIADGETRRLLGCLFTVFMEQAALSRSDTHDRPEHFLILDEFAEFSAQSSEALSRMLSQTRKFGLFLVLVHQQWEQASERLKAAMQNCGLEVVFRLGHSDAEFTAASLARVDPRTVSTREGSGVNAAVMSVSVSDQLVEATQKIKGLPPRQALVRLPDNTVSEITTVNVPDPKIDTSDLELAMLGRYFKRPEVTLIENVEPVIRRLKIE